VPDHLPARVPVALWRPVLEATRSTRAIFRSTLSRRFEVAAYDLTVVVDLEPIGRRASAAVKKSSHPSAGNSSSMRRSRRRSLLARTSSVKRLPIWLRPLSDGRYHEVDPVPTNRGATIIGPETRREPSQFRYTIIPAPDCTPDEKGTCAAGCRPS